MIPQWQYEYSWFDGPRPLDLTLPKNLPREEADPPSLAPIVLSTDPPSDVVAATVEASMRVPPPWRLQWRQLACSGDPKVTWYFMGAFFTPIGGEVHLGDVDA